MPDYFDIKTLTVDRFPVQDQKHLDNGTEWRRLNPINLEWAEAVVSKGIAKPDADNERLGLAVLFVERLRAAIFPRDYPRDDLHEDFFGEWIGDF